MTSMTIALQNTVILTASSSKPSANGLQEEARLCRTHLLTTGHELALDTMFATRWRRARRFMAVFAGCFNVNVSSIKVVGAPKTIVGEQRWPPHSQRLHLCSWLRDPVSYMFCFFVVVYVCGDMLQVTTTRTLPGLLCLYLGCNICRISYMSVRIIMIVSHDVLPMCHGSPTFDPSHRDRLRLQLVAQIKIPMAY